MANRVHLIVEAGNRLGDIGELMQRLAGRQTRNVNKLEKRTGSLWESRYKISPIDTDAYLLQCCRYVELNPVKAKMVPRPEDYPWSSYRAMIGDSECSWLDLSSCFIALGSDPAERKQRYRKFIEDTESARREAIFIRSAADRSQLKGDTRFIDEIEVRTGTRVAFRARGRPQRNEK
jgi:putative transposase